MSRPGDAPPDAPLVAILGGGQLGLMLAQAAPSLPARVRLLDPSAEACAARVAELVVGGYEDESALTRLVEGAAAITYEFENVPVATCDKIAAAAPVRPPTGALRTAQDRLLERELFKKLGIPAPASEAIEDEPQIAPALSKLGAPAVLKARRFGYDGKGQHQVAAPGDAGPAWEAIGRAPAILDSFVPFTRELSIIAVRGASGETRFYPLAQNVHRGGILRLTRAPAPDVPESLEAQARGAAQKILDELNYVGVLAVEFFQVGAGAEATLLANEIAPRVHNTGHWTIEGAQTSQFENHLRAVLGMPLGACEAIGHTAMVNLIGELPPAARLANLEGAHFHDYGKTPRAGRKVGHVTLTAETREQLDALLDRFTRLVA